MSEMQTLTHAAHESAYHAALQGVVRYDDSARGRVRLTGRDRAELIQRLSTNDVVALRPGDGARTVLINHHARILDLLTVYALPEHLLVTTNPGQGAALTRFLRSKIFFNDKVTVEDLSAETGQIQLWGPDSAALIERVTGIDAREWPLHHVQAASLGGSEAWIARGLPIGGDGYVVLFRNDDRATVEATLAEARELDAATLNILRVEHGYPAPQHELTNEYIPLETGLNDAISFSKGCYVGQEIIARMDSRHRLAKRLMGLRLSAPIDVGSTLSVEGKPAAEVTSVVESPRFGPIGLAYVRTASAMPGQQLRSDTGVEAAVVELPFVAV